MRQITILLAAGCAALLLAGTARAASDSDLEQARQHAAKAKVHYDLGEYEKAAEEYIIVYRLRPLPALLFNIAQSYRQAGQYDKAKQFYQSYLRENPDSETTAQVKKALKEIDELQAKEKTAKNGPPTGVKQPPDASLPIKPGAGVAGAAVVGGAAGAASAGAGTPGSAAPAGSSSAVTAGQSASKTVDSAKVAVATQAVPPKAAPTAAVTPMITTTTTAPTASKDSGMRTAAWIAGGTAVALLGGGALFTAKAASTDSTLNNGGHTRAEADDLISQSNSQHKMGAILLGTGLVAAGTCAVLFLLP
jgi:tetratricopeptide (TPR) repeat protein